MIERCPTCGHDRETFQGSDGTGGFVPPKATKNPKESDMAGERFATVEDMGNFTYRVSILGEQVRASFLQKVTAEGTCERINKAIQSALDAKVEECAKVAGGAIGSTRHEIAAEIRKLKAPK